jgi:hypothetical protein
MIRNAASKVMWVGRATVFVVGLAVILALVLGTATMTLAAVPGDPFELGKTNTINDARTRLAGFRDGGAMLSVDNNSSAPGSQALSLTVEPGKTPVIVNSDAGKAKNLNADEVDG